MKKVVVGMLVGALGMFAWQRVMQPAPAAEVVEVADADEDADEDEEPAAGISLDSQPVERPNFTCDGRQYCSQMTSCEEAMYFLENCPDVKMDGERDGIPCERQWCERRR